MNHEQYKEWIILEYYGELEETYKQELENHLTNCDECRVEKEETIKLFGKISETSFFQPNEEIINEMRKEISKNIRKVKPSASLLSGLKTFIGNYILPQPKYAFSLSAILVIGLITGYLLFSPQKNISTNFHTASFTNTDYQTAEPQINNLKFISKDAASGEVEISFDEVMTIQFKGSINDVKIQKVLAQSLLTEENPGTRLKTVDAMGSNQSKTMDNTTKIALIKALKTDENQGVRKEALRVLRKIPFDDEIKEAYLYVLNNDKNSAMRILAINNLGDAKEMEKLKDYNTQNILKYKMENDDNDYIRMRAKTILMETK
jgi:hypothetical protein